MDWYVTCWKRYAEFSGRARRREYWYFVLFNGIVGILLEVPVFVAQVANGSPDPQSFFSNPLTGALLALFFLYALASFIPSIAVTVRRLHDTGRSGWWYFISFVPFVGPIILLVFACTEGTHGANQYGPDPKAVAAYSA